MINVTNFVYLIIVSFPTRYLYDRGLLKNVTWDFDPREISFNNCDYAIDHVRSDVRKKIQLPCAVNDLVFMGELEDLGIFKGLLEKNYRDQQEINAVTQKIGRKIHMKCNGMINNQSN